MAWQTRGDKKYFYRVFRDGGRVKSEYFGTGPEAEQAADAIAGRKALLRQRAEELDNSHRSIGSIASLTKRVSGEVRLLIDAALLTAGFYQHKRSDWRKRRGRRQSA